MTIRDVAEYSGVSVSTVSRVLNHHPDVSEAVRGRVMEAVRELRYVPNDSARDLVKSQSDAIGVVVRGASNPFFAPVIRAIEEEAEAAGCAMVLHQIRAGEDEIAAGAALARSKRLSGLILLGGRYDYTPSEVELLEVPFVCCTYTNHFGSLGQAEFSSVSIDDEAEAYRAETVAAAQADVAAFNAIYEEYKSAPEIMRTRLLIETLENVLSSSGRLYIVDGETTRLLNLSDIPADVASAAVAGGDQQ